MRNAGVVVVDDDLSVFEVRISKFFIRAAGIYHNSNIRLVYVGESFKLFDISLATKNCFAENPDAVAVRHRHQLCTVVIARNAAKRNIKFAVESVLSECRPRCRHIFNRHAQRISY